MLKLIPQIPAYILFRSTGYPHKLPLSLTLSLSFKCNSRCKTCNIYKKKTSELSLQEWRRVFESLGTSPFWVTISGGEPFLRADMPDVVCSLYDICKPSIINIPTNSILFKRIPDAVKKIVNHCQKSQIVINLSIDGIGENHNEIRGVPGNYDKVLNTFSGLKKINAENLSIGFHTVISKFNVTRIPEIYEHLRSLHPDSYITEIAEERVELGTINTSITPGYEDYQKAVDFLADKLKKEDFNKVGRITRAFRIEYYQMVKKVLLEQRQIIPCYAGFASAQIAPDGDIWMCCIKADPIGNLKDVDYDFGKLWFSEKSNQIRQSIKNKECFCPLANASYTNMLHNIKSLRRVAWNLMKMN